MKDVASERSEFNRTTFGFWIYLMTDCVLFASLFATYAVLRGGTTGDSTPRELFNIDYVLVETVVLLTSSLTSGLALLANMAGRTRQVVGWLIATFVLGAAFLGMELYEFNTLVQEGHTWATNAFLSSYFTLVGTHGLHIAIGLLWIIVLFALLWTKGSGHVFTKRLTLFSLFWHFLDIVWIFIFTLVYLMGVL